MKSFCVPCKAINTLRR